MCCPGGKCPGGSYRGVIIQGVVVLGVIVRVVVIRGLLSWGSYPGVIVLGGNCPRRVIVGGGG